MKVIGIVGGTGAGKTEVLRLLAAHGAATVAADELNRELLAPGQPTLAAVRREFGDEYFTPDGELRRRALGDLIFRDPAARRRLEQLVHPAMLAALQERLATWRRAGVAVAVVEAAVLEQMGAIELVDRVLLVTAPAAVRAERLARRDNLTAEQAAVRLAAQESMGLTTPRADYTLENAGDRQALALQVEQFWATLV